MEKEKIGALREHRLEEALERLRREGRIKGFIKTSRFDPSDRRGVDFFVIKIGKTSYEVFPIQVTGRRWVSTHRQKHPHIPVVSIDLSMETNEIAQNLLEILVPRS